GGSERLGSARTQRQGPGCLAQHTPMLLVRVAPGAKGAAAGRALTRAGGQDTEIVRPFLPQQLTNLRRAGDEPTVLSGFLIVLGSVALVHALFVAIRAGRRDLAVLRAL